MSVDAVTVDKVVCGEQQPESDHSIKTEKSFTGITDDTHWREARGWFSYELKNSSHEARFLYLSYFHSDGTRNFEVLVNDEPVKTVSLSGDKGMEPQLLLLPIPGMLTGEETLTVKITATPGSMTARIAEVRLLTQALTVEE